MGASGGSGGDGGGGNPASSGADGGFGGNGANAGPSGLGGPGGNAGNAEGGGIYCTTMSLSDYRVSSDDATGGTGGAGGVGGGAGGVNSAEGGVGGFGGGPGAGGNGSMGGAAPGGVGGHGGDGAPGSKAGNGGLGGEGGNGLGGAIDCTGAVTLNGDTFLADSAAGGNGAASGPGGPGGVGGNGAPEDFNGDTDAAGGNGGRGGNGGNGLLGGLGGNADGGAVYGSASITNTTFGSLSQPNAVTAGLGGTGGTAGSGGTGGVGGLGEAATGSGSGATGMNGANGDPGSSGARGLAGTASNPDNNYSGVGGGKAQTITVAATGTTILNYSSAYVVHASTNDSDGGATLVYTIAGTSANTAHCTVSTSGVLTFTSTGQCSVDVNSGATEDFLAAAQVRQVATVRPGGTRAQTIMFNPLSATTLARSPVVVRASASSGLKVAFATTTPRVCTAGGTSGSRITLLRAGTCTVRASQLGNTTFKPAPPVSRSFTVRKSSQTIVFSSLHNKSLAQSPVLVKATASSGLAVTFTTTTPKVCTPGGTHGASIALVTTGTCTVRASQTGSLIFNPAAPVSRSFTVT
jgi:hypothetical protein